MTAVALHVDQLFFSVPGGIGTYVRELPIALARRDPGVALRLFHARFSSARAPEWTEAFATLEIPGSIRSLYPRWDLLARPTLPASLQSADVVHATNPAAIPPAARGQRLVVTVHDLAFERFARLFPPAWRWLYRAGLRAAVRRADAIIAVSRNTAEDLIARTPVRPEVVHVVPLAASLPEGDANVDAVLDRLRVPTPYVLFVGTLEPRKNLIRLVRAYRRVAATGAPHALVLAGGMGWHGNALLRELALEGPGDVVLTGALGGRELDAVYRGAAAFAYPSLYEGFGLPVLEAMARGIPVVASSTSSIPEVAGDAGIGVDPRSVSDIAGGLTRLLGDPALAGELARRGLERAKRFSWDETARRTLEVYEKGALG